MKWYRSLILPATLVLAAGAVLAQPASAPAAPAAPASRPGMGMGPGGGMGGMGGGMKGPGAGPRAGSENTPGWGLMSRAERQEHRAKMSTMKTEAECRDYLAQHHSQMAARASEKGVPMRGPKRDACAGLPK